MAKMWFTMKHHGWGWVPVTWLGWVVIAALIGWIVYVFNKFENGLYTEEALSPRWRWDRI